MAKRAELKAGDNIARREDCPISHHNVRMRVLPLGKSSAFPLAQLGTRYFNADDRAAELNGRSYLGIPRHIRETVNREFETFVSDCISRCEHPQVYRAENCYVLATRASPTTAVG